ncbi:MAG: minor capsid protein [Lactobacillus johnsonii]|nr:minor capsid protein [Lactobacillus johnsonii]
MKSSEYWKKRALSAKKKQLEASADYEAAMQSRLRDLEHDIEKEALGYLQRYANENNVGLKQAASVLGNINSTKWSMTLEEFERKAKAGGYEKELNAEYYKSRIFRLQQLHEQMVEFSKKYGIAEQLRMQKGLAKQYQNSYYLDAYNKYRATGQLDIKLNHFNEQQLENIVYRPWKGSDFSKRIWKEYTEVLPDELTDALLRGTLFGYSPSKVVRMIRDRFQKVSERDLHRLVITEMGHAAEEATAQFYKDSDIEQYQYLATLESHTCDQCAHLDERIFNVKDKKEGINYPLIHPYCRCTTVPYDKNLPDVETRWSRDPETGKGRYVYRNALDYSEWKKLAGVKILKLETPRRSSKSELKENMRALSKQLLFNDDGILRFLPKDVIINHVKVIAGNGGKRKLRIANILVEKYGYTIDEWKKCVGSVESDKYLFDIHWYEINKEKMYMPKIKNIRRRKK